jgi:hypothetical protein
LTLPIGIAMAATAIVVIKLRQCIVTSLYDSVRAPTIFSQASRAARGSARHAGASESPAKFREKPHVPPVNYIT